METHRAEQSATTTGSGLTCAQLVEQFNQLPGTAPVRYSSVIQKQFDVQCREYPDLPQLLLDALNPQFWPLARFDRDVTLSWLLQHPDTIIDIPSGSLSRPKPQRGRHGEQRAAATAGRRVIEPQPIDPGRRLVMPPGGDGSYWDAGLRCGRLVIYDQRQLELIRHLHQHLYTYDPYFNDYYLASLVLSGPSGTGKDLLLALLAEGVVDPGRCRVPTYHHDEIPELPLEALRAGELIAISDWDELARRYAIAGEAQLLILSDPECLANNKWHRERLSQLLRERSETGKPTWITTNCPTLAQLASAIEPPLDPQDRSPLERRLAVNPDQNFIRIEWPPYDRVYPQIESGELPFVFYEQLVRRDGAVRSELAELPPEERAQREQQYEWLPEVQPPDDDADDLDDVDDADDGDDAADDGNDDQYHGLLTVEEERELLQAPSPKAKAKAEAEQLDDDDWLRECQPVPDEQPPAKPKSKPKPKSKAKVPAKSKSKPKPKSKPTKPDKSQPVKSAARRLRTQPKPQSPRDCE